MRVALEIQHGVDNVLEYTRAGERAVLGDMADQDQAGAALLGKARELRGTLAHLGDRTRGRLQGLRVHRLDRIDDRHARAGFAQRVQDALEVDLGEHLQLGWRKLQTMRAQRHLFAGLLAADVDHFVRGRQVGQGLQQQR